jgi:SAM-dependent methyltransferase
MENGALSYCKLCELADFRDPELRPLIREISGAGPDRPDFPDGEEQRKAWEVSMTLRALRDFGAIRDDAELLGVGAGREATIFWLTRHVRRVFATDLYLEEDSWSPTDSGAEMLIDPGRHVSWKWNPRRLVVQHMNGLDLRYEDESFDGIFSSGSIEHFGGLDDIRTSVEEMYRVLKPGGVAALATEYRLGGPPEHLPGTVLFSEDELRSVLLDGFDWKLASPLELSISEESMRAPIDFQAILEYDAAVQAAEAPQPRWIRRVGSRVAGRSNNARGGVAAVGQNPAEEYPHIVLFLEDHLWTSVHLALIKPGAR